MKFLSNLGIRAHLIRTAVTKRFIYDDVVALALSSGPLPVDDVAANLEPIALLQRLRGTHAFIAPDFSALSPEAMLSNPAAPKIWSSERNAAEFVGRLAALLRAQTVCEIGCFIGYTTGHIASALRSVGAGGHLHYVDLDPVHLETATANLARLGLASFGTPHCGASHDPATLSALPAQIDLAFIDTTHSYEDTVAEIAAYGPRLTARGCLVLHDSIRFPGVRQAIAEARGSFDAFTFATERGNGVTVLTHRT